MHIIRHARMMHATGPSSTGCVKEHEIEVGRLATYAIPQGSLLITVQDCIPKPSSNSWSPSVPALAASIKLCGGQRQGTLEQLLPQIHPKSNRVRVWDFGLWFRAYVGLHGRRLHDSLLKTSTSGKS